ncbi:MAG: hypothetical protein D6806_04180, partial [Deltaproteobacteria bacterium]
HSATRTSLAAVARLVLVAECRFELSDDIYRYRWDGKVLASGMNPYLHPPSHPVMDELRTGPLDGKINHPDARTVYPPLAQLVFAAGYLLDPGGIDGLRLLGLFAELLAWIVLLVHWRRGRLEGRSMLLVALLPLVFLEGYLPGHVDVYAMVPLAAFLVLYERGNMAAAAAMLALCVLVRPQYALLVPAAAFGTTPKKAALGAVVFVAVVAAGYVPFLSAGVGLASSLLLMVRYWNFNGAVGWMLQQVLPEAVARGASFSLLAATTVASAWFWRKEPFRAMAVAFCLYAAFSPVVFPWYFVGASLLVAFRPVWALAWLLVSLPLAETVAIGWVLRHEWHLAWWVRALEYVPFFALFAAEPLWHRYAAGSKRREILPGVD